MGLFLLLGAVVASVASWTPRDVCQFWVEPDKPATFWFDAQISSDLPIRNNNSED